MANEYLAFKKREIKSNSWHLKNESSIKVKLDCIDNISSKIIIAVYEQTSLITIDRSTGMLIYDPFKFVELLSKLALSIIWIIICCKNQRYFGP